MAKQTNKSLEDCLRASKSDEDKNDCRIKYSDKKKKTPEMTPEEKKIWSRYIVGGDFSRHYLSDKEEDVLDSLIQVKSDNIEESELKGKRKKKR